MRLLIDLYQGKQPKRRVYKENKSMGICQSLGNKFAGSVFGEKGARNAILGY